MYKEHDLIMRHTNRIFENCLWLFANGLSYDTPRNTTKAEMNHLYVLSDDEIEKGDWYSNGKNIFKCDNIKDVSKPRYKHLKKIIATTNISLIEDNKSIKLIPKSFVKYFIKQYNKGNTIAKVNIEYEKQNTTNDEGFPDGLYSLGLKVNKDNTINIKTVKDSYSRKEVIRLCNKAWLKQPNTPNMLEEFNNWIEQNL